MNFGEKVRQLRKQKGWTQKELADRLQVSMRTVVSYEGGKSYPKQRELYDVLARLFSVDVNYLYIETEEDGMQASTPRTAETLVALGMDSYPPTRKAAEAQEAQEGRFEADRLVREVSAMFAGGKLSEEDKDAVMRALQEAYWDARRNKTEPQEK